MTRSEFLRVALEAVKKAEKIIMKYYSEDIRAKLKPDQSPVTIADIEAEKIIIETIKRKFPEHGFYGEESGESKSESEYVWIIDPIDGTKNYIRKIPLFGTLLALMKNDEVILGVSNIPGIRELMYAEKDKGAFLNNKPIRVSKVDEISKAMICYGGVKHFIKKGWLKNLSKPIGNAYRDRGFGDLYMYHLLATGRADIVVEAAISIQDIAALKIIVEEAGGLMTDIKGNPVDKNIKTVIASNKLLHDEVVRYFK